MELSSVIQSINQKPRCLPLKIFSRKRRLRPSLSLLEVVISLEILPQVTVWWSFFLLLSFPYEKVPWHLSYLLLLLLVFDMVLHRFLLIQGGSGSSRQQQAAAAAARQERQHPSTSAQQAGAAALNRMAAATSKPAIGSEEYLKNRQRALIKVKLIGISYITIFIRKCSNLTNYAMLYVF